MRELELTEDRLLEEHEYRDEGCDLFPSCLNCPLPSCRYDQISGRRHRAKGLRDMQIMRLHSVNGKSVGELAKSFGVSKRTVYRIIGRASYE